MTRHWSIFALLLFLSVYIVHSDASKKNKIKLRDIEVITLRHGHWTTGRRTRPVPQLQCIGGTNRCKFLPQVVQCYNRGFNGEDIQWECKADLNANLRFNKIDVTCEGYDFPEDDYVLVGSCGLEYSIDTTDGTIPFPKPHFNKPHPNNLPKRPKKSDEPGFMTVVVLGIIASFMYLIYKNCIEPMDTEARRRRRASPPPSAPPPPPGFMPGFTPDDSSSHSSFTSSSHTSSSTSSPDSGFWSGFTWGGMAGYLLGSVNRNDQSLPPRNTEQRDTSSTSSSWSSWFWSQSNLRHRHRPEEHRREERSSFSRSSPEPSNSTQSSESHTSSGFGGTSRR